MVVLHILLTILKLLGILLLVVLGLVLLLFLSLLFCPVGYRLQGKKDQEGCQGTGKVYWLFHLISVKCFYEGREGKKSFSVRIFGIPLEKFLGFLEKKKNKKAEKQQQRASAHTVSEKREEQCLAEAKEGKQPSVCREKEVRSKTQASEISDLGKKTEEEKTSSFFKKLIGMPQKVIDFLKVLCQIPGKLFRVLKNFRLTWKKICVKIKSVKELWDWKPFQRSRVLFLAELKKFFRRIQPGKIKGHVKFGFEDPCLTGELLGGLGIFYPLYGKHFTIEPYFDQKIFQGEIFVKGRIYGIHFALLAWNLLRSQDIRCFVKRIKTYI